MQNLVRWPAYYILLAFALCGSPLATTPLHAQMVHDTGAIPGALHTPEAQEEFREQMAGTPAPDDLGAALPPGLSAKTLAAMVVPLADIEPVGTIGAKRWPAEPGRFIVLVCTGGDGPGKTGADGCQTGSDHSPALNAYLAIVELKDGKPVLVTPPVRVDPAVDWQHSLLPNLPQSVEDPDPGGSPAPNAYDRIDVAPYRIAADTPAFGLRASWSDGYAGGFGWHSALVLYAVVAGALRPVLAVPVLALTDYAGDWNRDGSRQHEVHEGANVLIVADHLSDGHFDLLLRSRLTRREHLFRWQSGFNAYRLIVQ